MPRCLETIDICIRPKFVCMPVVVTVWVCGNVCCVVADVEYFFNVCVRDVIDVVFSVCIVTRGAVGAPE